MVHWLLFLLSSHLALSATYNHGDACATAGAYHLKNDASKADVLVCDGANWKLAISFSKDGNQIELDGDPNTGSSGCMRYNSTTSKLEYSDDCSSFTSFGGFWQNDGPGGSTKLYYNGGNVGIGTNNPGYPLTVSGNANFTNLRDETNPTQTYITSTNNITNLYAGGDLYASFNGASHVSQYGTDNPASPAAIILGYNNVLYIDNQNARVGIKTNTPGAELDVVGDIHYTGDLLDVSDRREKENIQPLSNSLEKIKQLNGYSFTMKNDPKHDLELGLMAQEVELVFPELVMENAQGRKALNYSGLIAPMLEAIKERDEKNNLLNSELRELADQYQRLLHRLNKIEEKACHGD